MNARLLKNAADFADWKSDNIFFGDKASEPERFPCWARTVVLSWNCEEEEAVYMYLEDVAALLASFEA